MTDSAPGFQLASGMIGFVGRLPADPADPADPALPPMPALPPAPPLPPEPPPPFPPSGTKVCTPESRTSRRGAPDAQAAKTTIATVAPSLTAAFITHHLGLYNAA